MHLGNNKCCWHPSILLFWSATLLFRSLLLLLVSEKRQVNVNRPRYTLQSTTRRRRRRAKIMEWGLSRSRSVVVVVSYVTGEGWKAAIRASARVEKRDDRWWLLLLHYIHFLWWLSFRWVESVLVASWLFPLPCRYFAHWPLQRPQRT